MVRLCRGSPIFVWGIPRWIICNGCELYNDRLRPHMTYSNQQHMKVCSRTHGSRNRQGISSWPLAPDMVSVAIWEVCKHIQLKYNMSHYIYDIYDVILKPCACIHMHAHGFKMTSWHGNVFYITGLLRGEFTGHRRFPPYTGPIMWFDIFCWQVDEQTTKLPVIWDVSRLIWRNKSF